MDTIRLRLRSQRVLLALMMTNHLLICAENDELNPGPDQSTETLKSIDTSGGQDVENVDKMLANMSERQREKVLADLHSLKSQKTSVQGPLNRADAEIDDPDAEIGDPAASNKELKVKGKSGNQTGWRPTAAKAITGVIGVIAILAFLGIVLRKTRFKSPSSKSGTVVEKHTLRPVCKKIKKEKKGVEHEPNPTSV